MKALIRYADSKGLDLALTASPDYGSDKNKLESWYASLGFKYSNKGPKGTEMIRLPSVDKESFVCETVIHGRSE